MKLSKEDNKFNNKFYNIIGIDRHDDKEGIVSLIKDSLEYVLIKINNRGKIKSLQCVKMKKGDIIFIYVQSTRKQNTNHILRRIVEKKVKRRDSF